MARKTRSEAGAELAASLMSPEPPKERAPCPVGTVMSGCACSTCMTYRRGLPTGLPAVREGTEQEIETANAILADSGFGDLPPPEDDFPLGIPEGEGPSFGEVADLPFESYPFNGLVCCVCKEPQRTTPGGASCVNAHGGADGLLPANPGSPPARAPLYATAHGPSLGISPDYQRIVETFHVVDAKKEYDELERQLAVGEQRGDYGTLRRALDDAESNARRAHKLLLGGKIERDNWDLDNRKVLAGLKDAARAKLEEEKAAGTRKKQITIDDVDDYAAEMFPDEWKHQKVTERRLKNMVDDLEDLVERWRSRCFTLRTLLETLRK